MVDKIPGHYIIFKTFFDKFVVDIPEETLSLKDIDYLLGRDVTIKSSQLSRLGGSSVSIPAENIDDAVYESLFYLCGKIEIIVPPKSLNRYVYIDCSKDKYGTYVINRKLRYRELLKNWRGAGMPKYWNPNQDNGLWNTIIKIKNIMEMIKAK